MKISEVRQHVPVFSVLYFGWLYSSRLMDAGRTEVYVHTSRLREKILAAGFDLFFFFFFFSGSPGRPLRLSHCNSASFYVLFFSSFFFAKHIIVGLLFRNIHPSLQYFSRSCIHTSLYDFCSSHVHSAL